MKKVTKIIEIKTKRAEHLNPMVVITKIRTNNELFVNREIRKIKLRNYINENGSYNDEGAFETMGKFLGNSVNRNNALCHGLIEAKITYKIN